MTSGGATVAVSASALVEAAVATRSADIARFEPVWRRLFDGTSSEPSTSFEWTAAMLQHHLEPADRFALIQLSRNGSAISFVPLVTRSANVLGQRLAVMTPLSERYNTHSGLLGDGLDAHAVASLVAAITALDGGWDIFRMSRVLEHSSLADSLRRAAIACDLGCDVHYTQPAYFLELPPSFDEYLAGRSAKFRQDLRRAARKLQAAGRVDVSSVPGDIDFETAYDAVLSIERASWKHAHGTAISAVPRQTGFYRSMGRVATAAGRLDLQILTLDGEPTAYNLGYVHDGCYSYLKTSFDDRRQTLSPSMFLRARLIERLIERGILCMDFPGEPYEWEARWTPTYRWHTCVTMYNRTLKARAVRWVNRLRRRSRTRPDVVHCDPLAIEAPRQ
jgi:CelD/BcsL family acetyltransferase involved in cellulose biosynthesis